MITKIGETAKKSALKDKAKCKHNQCAVALSMQPHKVEFYLHCNLCGKTIEDGDRITIGYPKKKDKE